MAKKCSLIYERAIFDPSFSFFHCYNLKRSDRNKPVLFHATGSVNLSKIINLISIKSPAMENDTPGGYAIM
jgi:tRNA A37 threonylcarbamoyladenosine synthetase subunit TsaC/SUA5/YrdC